MKRKCCKCQLDKPLDQFRKNRGSPLGYNYWCIECARAYDRIRDKNPERLEKKRIYFKSEDFKKRQLGRRNRNLLKFKARENVALELRMGRIVKGICFCGNLKTEAHHEDYNKPLDVIWLCKKHHGEVTRLK